MPVARPRRRRGRHGGVAGWPSLPTHPPARVRRRTHARDQPSRARSRSVRVHVRLAGRAKEIEPKRNRRNREGDIMSTLDPITETSSQVRKSPSWSHLRLERRPAYWHVTFDHPPINTITATRSEERRVGKECRSPV